MQKSEFWITTFHYVLGGLVSNPSSVKAKVTDLVESAFTAATYAADRYENIISSMDPPVVQQFTVGAIPADPTITYTYDQSASLNTTKEIAKESTVPTAVRQPDTGDYIAPKTSR